jgi:hypothetical protein
VPSRASITLITLINPNPGALTRLKQHLFKYQGQVSAALVLGGNRDLLILLILLFLLMLLMLVLGDNPTNPTDPADSAESAESANSTYFTRPILLTLRTPLTLMTLLKITPQLRILLTLLTLLRCGLHGLLPAHRVSSRLHRHPALRHHGQWVTGRYGDLRVTVCTLLYSITQHARPGLASTFSIAKH